MINFQVFGLCHLLLLLRNEEDAFRAWANTGHAPNLPPGIPVEVPSELPKAEKDRLKGFIEYSGQIAKRLELQAVHDRVEIFTGKMRFRVTLSEVVAELMALREAIEKGVSYSCFYHYPPDKARVLLSFQTDWKAVIEQFPSTKEDASAAVDCWALGHNTACVFHLMRVAEHGLRALARERRVKLPKNRPLEWGEWQAIISGISKQADIIASKRAGAPRDAALEFYRGALGEFYAFKDAYRNSVMHTRATYDEHQAQSAMLHVRGFMSRLSQKIAENMTKQVAWRIR
jgi:hypothetical protein